MPRQTVAAARVVQDFPAPVKRRRRPADPQTAALLAQAEAMAAVAKAIDRAVDTFEPALQTVHSFGNRLDALCMFLKRKGPWLLASVPGVLVAVQAISPNAAKALSAVLQGVGVQ